MRMVVILMRIIILIIIVMMVMMVIMVMMMILDTTTEMVHTMRMGGDMARVIIFKSRTHDPSMPQMRSAFGNCLQL